jgi:hypothetical protein
VDKAMGWLISKLAWAFSQMSSYTPTPLLYFATGCAASEPRSYSQVSMLLFKWLYYFMVAKVVLLDDFKIIFSKGA